MQEITSAFGADNTYVEVRLDPDAVCKNWVMAPAEESRWGALEGSLVFGWPDAPTASIIIGNPKMPATANVIGISEVQEDQLTHDKFRCIGVITSHIKFNIYNKYNKLTIPIACTGQAWIRCDPADMSEATYGDYVIWQPEEINTEVPSYKTIRLTTIKQTKWPDIRQQAELMEENALITLTFDQIELIHRTIGTIRAKNENGSRILVQLRT